MFELHVKKILTVLTSLAYVITISRVSAIDTNVTATTLTPPVWYFYNKPVMYFQPEQVHIAIGENMSVIVVTWSTKNLTESAVEYGINGLTLRATGSSTKFVDDGPRKFFQ